MGGRWVDRLQSRHRMRKQRIIDSASFPTCDRECDSVEVFQRREGSGVPILIYVQQAVRQGSEGTPWMARTGKPAPSA